MAVHAVETSQDVSRVEHLVVLIHGLWGNPVHLTHLRDTLAAAHEGQGLYILIPSSNRDNHTYDGIEVGAERVTHEIEDVLKDLEAAGSHVQKISIAGYSLGGLVCRYVVGLLYSAGILDRIQPMNFTTFATPHLGVRTPRLGYRAQTWNFLGSRTLSTSGQQMFLADNFRGTGRQLLSIMADPSSVFMRGLAMFKKRSIYANTLNDRSVPFYTSAMSRTDPYVDLSKIDVHPLPNQELPVILDPENPVTPRKGSLKPLTYSESLGKVKESLPFYAFLFAFIPLAVPLFMINAGYQTYQSAQRVRLHETGKAFDLKRYRVPLLEESQHAQDKLVSNLAGASTNQEYLPTPPPEPQSPKSSSTTLAQEQKDNNDGPWPTLALTKEQFEMIDNLDEHIRFTKYPVHMQKVRHTHAAIVVRMPKDSFVEGKVVTKHWATGFLPSSLVVQDSTPHDQMLLLLAADQRMGNMSSRRSSSNTIQPDKLDWTSAAAQYQDDVGKCTALGTRELINEIDARRPFSAPGICVLDVGTGAGAIVMAVKDKAPEARILATDISPGMIKEVEALGIPDVVTGRYDAVTLSGLPDDKFSHGLTAFTINYTTDPEACVHSLYRVIKPGGYVGIAIWGPTVGPGDVHEKATDMIDPAYKIKYPVGEKAWRDQETHERKLQQAGFADVEVRTVQLPFGDGTIEGITDFWFRSTNPVARKVVDSWRAQATGCNVVDLEAAFARVLEEQYESGRAVVMDAVLGWGRKPV
ncbi:DUF676-domain-containing protein [Teratosphaeria nubilosa]|uniref:DUF676-domain-containing protein n=1 Tax=Teratosphaeria nubilosa TaxID=161662 RepID=A0A6G1KXQ9_9PEZI|nr:DUF676-domain-containing protein [Teratosphaeria nubilosa]